MGRNVLISLKVMPEDIEVNLDNIKKQIKSLEGVEIKDMKEEPVAFGIKALKLVVLVEDKEKVGDEVQEKIQGIEGVESVDIEGVTLI